MVNKDSRMFGAKLAGFKAKWHSSCNQADRFLAPTGRDIGLDVRPKIAKTINEPWSIVF